MTHSDTSFVNDMEAAPSEFSIKVGEAQLSPYVIGRSAAGLFGYMYHGRDYARLVFETSSEQAADRLHELFPTWVQQAAPNHNHALWLDIKLVTVAGIFINLLDGIADTLEALDASLIAVELEDNDYSEAIRLYMEVRRSN